MRAARPKQGRSGVSPGRGRTVVAALVGIAVLAASSSHSEPARQPLPDALSVGEWSGHASAIGVTDASASGMTIVIQGMFRTPLDFVVPNSGPVTGQWSLRGSTNWRMIFEGRVSTVFAQHSATGSIEGDRERLDLGQSIITTTGTVDVPGAGAFPVASADPLGPLALEQVAVFCDDAIGEWILSWNTILSGASFSPTFRGNWQARRVQGDGPSVERTRQLMPQLFELRDRLIATWDDVDATEPVPELPLDTVTALIAESVAVINELNNLSDCDVQYLGEDNVRQWIYSFTRAISLLTLALNDAVQAQATSGFASATPPTRPPSDLVSLATILASSGTVGPGSLDQDADEVLSILTAGIETAAADATATDADRRTALALADQLGITTP